MTEYFVQNPPSVFYLDGSEVRGWYLYEANTEIYHNFDPSNIVAFDWQDVELTVESKWRSKRDKLNGRPTRFEKGDVTALVNLKRRLRKLRANYEICVVRPGISKAPCDPEISTMLGAAENLVHELTGNLLKVIASP